VRRRELACLPEDATGLGHIAQREVLLDGEWVDVALQAAVREQRFQLGAEQQRAIVEQGVMQRLDGEPIPGEEQRVAVPIPQRKGEHSAEALDAVLAPRLPRMDDDLGIALGAEHMAERHQLRNQLLVVVDLAVVDHDHRAVLVEQRLLAGRHVDDREAPVAQAQAWLDVDAAFVGSAMVLRLVHAMQDRAVDLALAARVKDARDAAHAQLGCAGARSGTPRALSWLSYKER
jgi:hypothetical protein